MTTTPLPGTFISQLPQAIVLVGTEDIPLVQSGTTKRASASLLLHGAQTPWVSDVDANGFSLKHGQTSLTLGTAQATGQIGAILDVGTSEGGLDIRNSATGFGPYIDLVATGSHAVFDFIGNIGFRALNSAASQITYSGIDVWIIDPTAGNELAGFAQFGAPRASYSFTIANGVVIGDGVFGALAPGPGIGSIAIEKNIFLPSGDIEFTEIAAPANGPANTGRLFARDNGAGKTQLCVIFNTGAVQVIATQP